MSQINELTLVINNVQYAYVPNSLEFNKGGGKRTINANSTGGGGTDITSSRDITEAMGMVKFQLRNTIPNDAAVSQWFESNSNAIRLSGSDGFALSFTSMVMEEDPDRPTANDGVIDVMFKGNPAV